MSKTVLTEYFRKTTICSAAGAICNSYPQKPSHSYGKRFTGYTAHKVPDTGVLIPDQEGNNLQRPNSSFCKPLKNISEGCPSNQVSTATMTSSSDQKWRTFNCFFSRVGLRTYRHPYIHHELCEGNFVAGVSCSQYTLSHSVLSNHMVYPEERTFSIPQNNFYFQTLCNYTGVCNKILHEFTYSCLVFP